MWQNMWKEKFIKAYITKIHTKKRETEKRKERYQVGGLGGFVKPAQGMADQRQQVAARCQGQWLGGGAGQQGGRSNGAFPGDGEPGTVNGGKSRTYHMDGWPYIFCSRRRCSAEAKQQGAVQRLGLASRLQQGTVLQDYLNPIAQRFSPLWSAPI